MAFSTQMQPVQALHPSGGGTVIAVANDPRFHFGSNGAADTCKLDLNKDEDKKKFLQNYGTFANNTFKSADLDKFLDTSASTTKFTRNGEIIISGLNFKVPDLAAQNRKEFLKSYDMLKKVSLNEKEGIKKSIVVNTTINTILAGVIAMIIVFYFLGYMFYTRSPDSV